jgi:hypothetical protein
MMGGAPLIGLLAQQGADNLAKTGHPLAAVIFPAIIGGILGFGGCYVLWRDRHEIAEDLRSLWRRIRRMLRIIARPFIWYFNRGVANMFPDYSERHREFEPMTKDDVKALSQMIERLNQSLRELAQAIRRK